MISGLLTAIGLVLIFLFTLKIVAFYRNQIKLNWFLLVLHLFILIFLVVGSMLNGFYKNSFAIFYVY